MKGILIDVKTKLITAVEDGLPFPDPPVQPPPVEVDLTKVAAIIVKAKSLGWIT